jgi:hypothetical protein
VVGTNDSWLRSVDSRGRQTRLGSAVSIVLSIRLVVGN